MCEAGRQSQAVFRHIFVEEHTVEVCFHGGSSELGAP